MPNGFIRRLKIYHIIQISDRCRYVAVVGSGYRPVKRKIGRFILDNAGIGKKITWNCILFVNGYIR